jgi:GR25 family glycosyltransferase involved in LPS biosynthesis
MADRKLFVVVIRTPNSNRYLPIDFSLKDDSRFEIVYVEASMTPSYSDISDKNILYSTETFEYFHGRKLMPAEIGCADSHNKARQLIQRRKIGGVILEDDARIISIDAFYLMATNFLTSQVSNPSILNFTGLNQKNLEISNYKFSNNIKYVKLWGTPALAVAYALTTRAASDLLQSNIPIKDVSDWPITKCRYFVPLIPQIRHGDLSTLSLIDASNSNFRNKRSKSSKLLDLSIFKFLYKKPCNVKFFYYLQIVYIKRFLWYADRIKYKLLIRLVG